MWVASNIKAIEIKQSGGRVIIIIIKGASSSMAERQRGGREAAIIQTRVQHWEASISRQQGGTLRIKANSLVGTADPIKSPLHMALVRETLPRPRVSKLTVTESRDPGAHVMPHSSVGPIEGSIMV